MASAIVLLYTVTLVLVNSPYASGLNCYSCASSYFQSIWNSSWYQEKPLQFSDNCHLGNMQLIPVVSCSSACIEIFIRTTGNMGQLSIRDCQNRLTGLVGSAAVSEHCESGYTQVTEGVGSSNLGPSFQQLSLCSNYDKCNSHVGEILNCNSQSRVVRCASCTSDDPRNCVSTQECSGNWCTYGLTSVVSSFSGQSVPTRYFRGCAQVNPFGKSGCFPFRTASETAGGVPTRGQECFCSQSDMCNQLQSFPSDISGQVQRDFFGAYRSSGVSLSFSFITTLIAILQVHSW